MIPQKKNRRRKGSSTVDRYLTAKERKIVEWYEERRKKEQ